MGRDKRPRNSRIMLFRELPGSTAWRYRQPFFEVENSQGKAPRYDAKHIGGIRGHLRRFQVRTDIGVLKTVGDGAPLTPADVARIIRVDLKSLLLPSMSRWAGVTTVEELDATILACLVDPKTLVASSPT